jgi:hypothetical protein
MIWLLHHPLIPPLSKLDRRHTGRLRKIDNLLTGEGGGAKSYEARKPGLNKIVHFFQHKCDLYLIYSIRGRGRMKKGCKYIEKKTQKKNEVHLKSMNAFPGIDGF